MYTHPWMLSLGMSGRTLIEKETDRNFFPAEYHPSREATRTKNEMRA
jgi:hypothetical protein